jgi:hypothetical protein
MFDPSTASSAQISQGLQEVQSIMGLLKVVIGALFLATSGIVATTWRLAKSSAEAQLKIDHGEAAYRELYGIPEEEKPGLRARHKALEEIVTEHSARLRGVVTGTHGHGSDPDIIARNIEGHIAATVEAHLAKARDAATVRRALIDDQERRFPTGPHRALEAPREAPRAESPYRYPALDPHSLDEDPFPSDPPPPRKR